jgi:hypothetical protein
MWFAIDTQTKWGDYWTILISGMTGHLGRSGEQLQLERTGPFVPPMVSSGLHDLIVTEPMRKTLDAVPGVKGFRAVRKSRIVRLDWSSWNLDGDCIELTRFREPEDTILSGQHDPVLAAELGEIYEVLLESDGEIDLDYDDDYNPRYTFRELPKRGFDFFTAKTDGDSDFPIATAAFVGALSQDVKKWLEFIPVAAETN